MTKQVNRRDFGKATASAAAVASLPTARILGANDSIRIGFVGVGNRGSQLMKAFAEHKDAKIVGVADAYQPYLDRAQKDYGSDLMAVEDYRLLLDRKDIDAIAIATPDHWHALQAITAMSAGKDVYVEKPLAATIHEGRQMVNAAKKFERVVQVGLHRRSMKIYHQLFDYMNSDAAGKITVSRAYRLNNMYPEGIGKRSTTSPPAGLNWDLWLGPRQKQTYQDNIAPYKFRWWQHYSSQMGNWGVHYFDVMRWMLGEESPSSVSAMGGRFAVDDDRTIPDTAEAVFEMPGKSLITFGQYEASSNPALAFGEVEFRGTQGTVYSSSKGFQTLKEKAGQFQKKGDRGDDKIVETNEPNHVATAAHARNFLDCVKSRKETHCPVLEGHRSTIFAHLANISLATRSRLDWNPETEQCLHNDKANNLLHYEYREGYKLPII